MQCCSVIGYNAACLSIGLWKRGSHRQGCNNALNLTLLPAAWLARSPQSNKRLRYRTAVPTLQRCLLNVSELENQTLCCYKHRSLRSFLLSEYKRDRIETLTLCAEWFQFAVDYFFFDITAVRNEITFKAPPGDWICK